MKSIKTPLIIIFSIFIIFYVVIWEWIICRIYVPPGAILYINCKVGRENPHPEEDRVVDPGTKGVQKVIYGEGRYFINPIFNDRNLIYKDSYQAEGSIVEIGPLETGIVESKSGKNIKGENYLIDPDKNQKGIVKDPLTPGIWRLNPYAYRITKIKAIKIEPGFVGCVTSKFGKNPPEGRLAREGERGVMEKVLQPGIYYINTRAYEVEKVEIGYRQTLFPSINFKSKDGFDIEVDISVVWGILPDKVPYIIDRIGNIEDVTHKIILPQVESLCRIEGSKHGAVELIEGPTREKFQNSFTQKLRKICESKDIQVLLGLVRNIQIPQTIREPIQKEKIAQEEKKTKIELQKTQKLINELERLKQEVIKAIKGVRAETEKIEATILAEGEKKVAEIKADQEIEVAKLKKEVARIEAEITRLLGKANADAKELQRRAEADKLVQNIKALGGAESYTLYTFAKNLSDKLKIFIRHSGIGTLWTDLPWDLKKIETLSSLKILDYFNNKKKINKNLKNFFDEED